MTKTRVQKREDGGIVLTACSPEGVTVLVQFSREEAMEMQTQMSAKLLRGTKPDWQDPEGAGADDLRAFLRHTMMGMMNGVRVGLGTLDAVQGYAEWDETTARRMHRELGERLQELSRPTLIHVGVDKEEETKGTDTERAPPLGDSP